MPKWLIMESGTLKILQAEGQVNLNNRSSYCILYLFFESDRKPEIKERCVGIKRAGSTFYRWEMIIYLLKSRHHLSQATRIRTTFMISNAIPPTVSLLA